MRAVPALMLMVTATWALLLAETFLFFAVVRPLAPNIHESDFSAGLKIGAVVGLLAVWGIAMFLLERLYVRRVVLASAEPALEPQK
jgi:hypothetical protein